MTSSAVGLVLVEGHEADGEIMDQDAFDVPTRRGATAISSSDYVAGALSRTRAIAEGRRPSAIGVTWSDDSEREASLFLKSLTEAGYQNIVAVRSPAAGEALARGIGRAVGYQATAVCLLQPESIVVSMVNTDDGAVQTVEHLHKDIGGDLTRWFTRVFGRNGWDPECLIVVGPDADLGGFTKRLERALGIPVFAPAEAEFALARGAALASAQSPDGTAATGRRRSRRARRAGSLAHTTALAMLVGGTATFVVSVCLAAGLKLTSTSSETKPSTPPAATPTVAATLGEAVPASAPPSVQPSPADSGIEPEQQPSTPLPEDAQTAGDTAPAQAPAQDQIAVDSAPPDAAPPAAPEPPPADPPLPPQGQDSQAPLLTRVLEHVPGLHPDSAPPANQTPAPPESPAPTP
jgi:pyruvate/2-oxoglutarate dehydrogenase complex dihydrolipoamide acyltransferase (E2) component